MFRCHLLFILTDIHLFTIYLLYHFSHLSNLVYIYSHEIGWIINCLSNSTSQEDFD